MRFFDNPKYEVIVFRMNTAGLLTCSLTFPPLSRGKVVYFLRSVEEKITQANFRKVNYLAFWWYLKSEKNNLYLYRVNLTL